MKLFDEDGNYVGEFVEDSAHAVGDFTLSVFEKSLILGFLVCFISLPIGIFLLVLSVIVKIITKLLFLPFRILWCPIENFLNSNVLCDW